MVSATLSKNGMIHLPREIQKKFELKPGDKISFVDTGEEVVVVPIKKLFDLVDPNEEEIAKNIVQELKSEHINEK